MKRADVRKIIRKATEKPQAKRYRSAAEMRVDIEHLDPTEKARGLDLRTVGIAAGVVALVGVALGLAFGRSSGDDVEQEPAVAESMPAVVKSPTSTEMFNTAIAYMSMNAEDSIHKAKSILATLAVDSVYAPAMLEFGMNYAQPTSAFPELAVRQDRLGIEPDLDESNKWLEMALEADQSDYKAAYWLYNNLMTKVDNESISKEEKMRLAAVFSLFKTLTAERDDEEAVRYREAMLLADDENTLKAWAIIK